MTEKIYQKPSVELDQSSLLLHALATCHSISYVNKEMIGDPLDIKMFSSTGWDYEDSSENAHLEFPIVKPPLGGMKDLRISIIRNFPFSSDLQRQSVIVKNDLREHPFIFLKVSSHKFFFQFTTYFRALRRWLPQNASTCRSTSRLSLRS